MDIEKQIQNEGFDGWKDRLLTLDSTFKFKCRKCGKCCKNQDTILFTPRDIFRIAQKVRKSPLDVVKDYTEVYIGPQSRIPLVHLLMRGPKNACPFLAEDGRCSIHDCKPIVCALYPLGRVVVGEQPGEAIDCNNKTQVRYIISGQCGSMKKTHTVRDWLADFGIPEDDKFFLSWTETITELGLFVRRLQEKKISERVLQPMWNAMFFNLYVNYDMSQKFFPQFQENSKKLRKDMAEIEKLMESATKEEEC